jgi:hypothetical protein
MIEASTETVAGNRFSAWILVVGMACAGGLMGFLAETLRAGSEAALSTLGGATAIWITIGFMLAQQIARVWPVRDRIAWISVVSAAYLFAWLIAYHTLFGILEKLSFAQVWPEARYWIAAVAPACLALGFVVVSSLRDDWLGDACLALPLGWSLPEVYLNVRSGASYIALVSIPTLLVALVPLAAARKRRWRPLVVVVVALLASGAIVYVLHSHLTLDDPSKSTL